MEIDELTDLTVEEQEDELSDLSTEQLKNLRQKETRRTAVQNIDNELGDRRQEEGQGQEVENQQETQPEAVEDDTEPREQEETEPEAEDEQLEPDHEQEEGGESEMAEDDRLEELEAKVDYLIEKVKTTSQQGFENYRDNQ